MAKILQLRKQNVLNVKNTTKNKMYLKNKTDSWKQNKWNKMQYSQQCWTKAYSNLLNSTIDFASTITERDIERPFIALVFLPTEQARSEIIFSGFAKRSITAPSCKVV